MWIGEVAIDADARRLGLLERLRRGVDVASSRASEAMERVRTCTPDALDLARRGDREAGLVHHVRRPGARAAWRVELRVSAMPGDCSPSRRVVMSCARGARLPSAMLAPSQREVPKTHLSRVVRKFGVRRAGGAWAFTCSPSGEGGCQEGGEMPSMPTTPRPPEKLQQPRSFRVVVCAAITAPSLQGGAGRSTDRVTTHLSTQSLLPV